MFLEQTGVEYKLELEYWEILALDECVWSFLAAFLELKSRDGVGNATSDNVNILLRTECLIKYSMNGKNKSWGALEDIRVRRRRHIPKTEHTEPTCRTIIEPARPIAEPKTPLPLLQTLKASNYAKKYHIADTPEMIFRVSELLEDSPQALQSQSAKLAQARTVHEQRSHQLTYLHQSPLRKETGRLERELLRSLDAIDKMPQLFVTDQIEYKQQILSGYFDLVVRDVARECLQRGRLLGGIWKATSSIFKEVTKLLAERVADGEADHLSQTRSTHAQYQSLIATYAEEYRRLTSLAREKQDFIDNLVFNLRYRRREIRKLYGAVKFASNCLNEYRRMYLDLEKEHIQLQMQVKDISREMAVFLIERRKHVLREKEKAIKVAQPRKRIRQGLAKEMEAESADARKHADEIEEGFNLTKHEKGVKHILVDDQLENVYGRLNVEMFENDFAGDADYGYADKSTSTNDFVVVGKDSGTQIARVEKFIEGWVRDRAAQTASYMAPVFRHTADQGTQTGRKQLERTSKLTEIKILSYTTRISTLEERSSSRSSASRKDKKDNRKSSQKLGKSRFSELPGSLSFEAFEKAKNRSFVNAPSARLDDKPEPLHRFPSFEKPTAAVHVRQVSRKFETQPSEQLSKISESQESCREPPSKRMTSKPSKYRDSSPQPRGQSSHYSMESNDTFTEMKRQHLKKAEDAKKQELMRKYMAGDLSHGSAAAFLPTKGDTASASVETLVEAFLATIGKGNLTEQDMQKLRSEIQTSISKGEKIMDLLLAPCRHGKLNKVKLTKKMSAELKMRRLFAIYQSAHGKILEGSKSDLTELIYDWFRESRLPNTELQMTQFLADIFQERNTNITFEMLALLTGVLPDSPFAPLVSQVDASMYLTLLFSLNCSPEHSLDKGYTTVARIGERLEAVLREYMGEFEARGIVQAISSLIETNKARLQLPQSSSSKAIKINLERAIHYIMNEVLQLKEHYYNDSIQLVRLLDPGSRTTSLEDLAVSFETFRFYCRCVWTHKTDYIAHMSRFLEEANHDADDRYMRIEAFSSFCLRFGIPLFKTTLEMVSQELLDRPDVEGFFVTGWLERKEELVGQLTQCSRLNPAELHILDWLTDNFLNGRKENFASCQKAYDLLEWVLFDGDAQVLTEQLLGGPIDALYSSSILLRRQ